MYSREQMLVNQRWWLLLPQNMARTHEGDWPHRMN